LSSSGNNQPLTLINKCVNQYLLNSIQKMTHCSFLNQQSASDDNQQLCQSISSRLDGNQTPITCFMQHLGRNINQQMCRSKKVTHFSCLSQQSTGNVNQQLCRSTESGLNTKGIPCSST